MRAVGVSGDDPQLLGLGKRRLRVRPELVDLGAAHLLDLLARAPLNQRTDSALLIRQWSNQARALGVFHLSERGCERLERRRPRKALLFKANLLAPTIRSNSIVHG